jgi:hypothetical protein
MTEPRFHADVCVQVLVRRTALGTFATTVTFVEAAFDGPTLKQAANATITAKSDRRLARVRICANTLMSLTSALNVR